MELDSFGAAADFRPGAAASRFAVFAVGRCDSTRDRRRGGCFAADAVASGKLA
jgi:hypothetical protein